MKKLLILRRRPRLSFGANIDSAWSADHLTNYTGVRPILNFLDGGIFAEAIGEEFAADRNDCQNEYFELCAHFSILPVSSGIW